LITNSQPFGKKCHKTAGEGVIFDSHCRGMVLSYGENFIP